MYPYIYFISIQFNSILSCSTKLPLTKLFFQFCQPGGWKTYNSPRPPECFNFVFTSGEGAYTYATCLSVFETCNDILENQDCIDVDDDLKPSFFYRFFFCFCPLNQDTINYSCYLQILQYQFYVVPQKCLEIYQIYVSLQK